MAQKQVAILQKAIDDANTLTTAATNSIAKSYTDKTLAKDLSGILATLKDVQTSLNKAKHDADEKQAEINADQKNQANYASFDMNGLRKKYTDAVATIKGYDEKVKSLFDVEALCSGWRQGSMVRVVTSRRRKTCSMLPRRTTLGTTLRI